MRLDDLDYDLPPELIAQEPSPQRDRSRLLVLDRSDDTTHHARFSELTQWLRPGDVLVVNDTKVIPARVLGTRAGHSGRIELLFVRPQDDGWLTMARPAKKLTPGTVLLMGSGSERMEVTGEHESGRRVVRFLDAVDPLEFLKDQGHMPLPPYIQREDTSQDRARYQTVFARAEGAVAAPTAGLHFTPEVLARLESMQVTVARVTLHVGPGTFVPVTAADPRDHRLEAERCRVSEAAAAVVNLAREQGRRIVAVGTTSVRTLETMAASTEAGWRLRSGSCWAETFIYPPYQFRLVDALITNFHLPRSSLLLLVGAFAGPERIRRAYAEAVREQYRFYSYGDAMLIL